MKVAAIMFGRRGSQGVPGKNVRPILGRPLCQYPIMAAHAAASVDSLYVSTDDDRIAQVAGKFGAKSIARPRELATSAAPLEDAIAHAFAHVIAREPELEAIVLLQANAPCITAHAIDQAVQHLGSSPALDSVVTVCELSQFAPGRARRLEVGRLRGELAASSSRHSGGETYFGDGGATVVRADVLRTLKDQPGPYPWQGREIGPVIQEPGPGDIDQEWQLAAAEWWLTKHGFTRSIHPYGRQRRAKRKAAPVTGRSGPVAFGGKSVALIGRAPYLIGSGLGTEIDGADMVVRVNWHLPLSRGLKAVDVGSRTDVLYLMPSAARGSRERAGRVAGAHIRIVDKTYRERLTYNALAKYGREIVWKSYLPNSGTVAIFDILDAGAAEVRVYGFDLHTSSTYVDTGARHHNRERWARVRKSSARQAHDPEVDRRLLVDLRNQEARFKPDARLTSVLSRAA